MTGVSIDGSPKQILTKLCPGGSYYYGKIKKAS